MAKKRIGTNEGGAGSLISVKCLWLEGWCCGAFIDGMLAICLLQPLGNARLVNGR